MVAMRWRQTRTPISLAQRRLLHPRREAVASSWTATMMRTRTRRTGLWWPTVVRPRLAEVLLLIRLRPPSRSAHERWQGSTQMKRRRLRRPHEQSIRSPLQLRRGLEKWLAKIRTMRKRARRCRRRRTAAAVDQVSLGTTKTTATRTTAYLPLRRCEKNPCRVAMTPFLVF